MRHLDLGCGGSVDGEVGSRQVGRFLRFGMVACCSCSRSCACFVFFSSSSIMLFCIEMG